MTKASSVQGVITYLVMDGRAGDACDFYIRAFAAEDAERMPSPDGQPGLMHAQVSINCGMLMTADHMGPDETASMNFGHLQLVVSDGRAWQERAVSVGCTEVMPCERQPGGDDWGLLRDPFGVSWGIMQKGSAK